jgi:hypothetical protein
VSRPTVALLVALAAVLVTVLGGCASGSAGRAGAGRSAAVQSSGSAVRVASPTLVPRTPRSADPPPTIPAPNRVGRARMTPGGLWWGVDSTGPMSADALANAQDWYLGNERPAVWGRYVVGHFGLRPGELAFARAHGIYVYLIVPDQNCSVCAGGSDMCGSDRTAAQAATDAAAAVRGATRAGVPARARLFKDIEQVGSCQGELTSDYLLAWYRTIRNSRYRVGFYGNTYRPGYDFPRVYCQALRREPQISREVILADDEPEPAIGAARKTIGPGTAPRFAPDTPACAPADATKIWQYGESTSPDNYTDVDEIMPDTTGLLAPDGSVTS